MKTPGSFLDLANQLPSTEPVNMAVDARFLMYLIDLIRARALDLVAVEEPTQEQAAEAELCGILGIKLLEVIMTAYGAQGATIEDLMKDRPEPGSSGWN